MGISIHALREEGDCLDLNRRHNAVLISIHALREEGDGVIDGNNAVSYEISIHALREEGDCMMRCIRWNWTLFLSTPSARRATKQKYTRAAGSQISIHALREEGDSQVV